MKSKNPFSFQNWNFSCPADAKFCYFLLMINQTANVTYPTKAEVQGAWDKLNCTVQLGCRYPDTFKPGPVPPEYVPPNVCAMTQGNFWLFCNRNTGIGINLLNKVTFAIFITITNVLFKEIVTFDHTQFNVTKCLSKFSGTFIQ